MTGDRPFLRSIRPLVGAALWKYARIECRHSRHSREVTVLKNFLFELSLTLAFASVAAAQYPTPAEADFVISNFRFTSGETLPQLRLHYRTLREPAKDAQGNVRNAMLVLHGTAGSGAKFIRQGFAGARYAPVARASS